jgi:hypothetical protein
MDLCRPDELADCWKFLRRWLLTHMLSCSQICKIKKQYPYSPQNMHYNFRITHPNQIKESRTGVV